MSVWNTGNNKRASRVPMEILKQSQLGTKCADLSCNVFHHDPKRMFQCKGPTLPVGISKKDSEVILQELKKEGFGLDITGGCEEPIKTYYIEYYIN